MFMVEDFNKLIADASKVYSDNFPATAWFGRCIFLSWFCDVGTCKFCFRSTIKHKIKHAKTAKRTVSSICVDAILGKHLGWRIEFLTGGYRIFSFEEMMDIIKKVSHIFDEKLWINLGALKKDELLLLKPYVEGICASIETVEPKLHKEICPDKPVKPYEDMLDMAKKLGFKTSMTIVIGLGEKKEDIDLLFEFIEKHELSRITFYALKPVIGSGYTKSPDIEEYAWWIAKTRIRFPKLEIIAGLTPRHPEYAKTILLAGANAITKFPVLKKFNTDKTRLIEEQVKEAGREFSSSLTRMPDVDFNAYIDDLPKDLFGDKLKTDIKAKLKEYLDSIESGKTSSLED